MQVKSAESQPSGNSTTGRGRWKKRHRTQTKKNHAHFCDLGTDASYQHNSQVAHGSQPEGGVGGPQVSHKMDGPKDVQSKAAAVNPQQTAQGTNGAGQKGERGQRGPREPSAAPLKSQKMFQPEGDSTSSGLTRFTPPKCRRCDMDMVKIGVKISERRMGYCPLRIGSGPQDSRTGHLNSSPGPCPIRPSSGTWCLGELFCFKL